MRESANQQIMPQRLTHNSQRRYCSLPDKRDKLRFMHPPLQYPCDAFVDREGCESS